MRTHCQTIGLCSLLLWLVSSPMARGATLAGRPAPPLVVTDLAGRALDLGALRGHVVVVVLWASWCPGCRAEMKTLDGFAEHYGPKGVEVVGLSVDGRHERNAVRKMAADAELPDRDARGRHQERLRSAAGVADDGGDRPRRDRPRGRDGGQDADHRGEPGGTRRAAGRHGPGERVRRDRAAMIVSTVYTPYRFVPGSNASGSEVEERDDSGPLFLADVNPAPERFASAGRRAAHAVQPARRGVECCPRARAGRLRPWSLLRVRGKA